MIVWKGWGGLVVAAIGLVAVMIWIGADHALANQFYPGTAFAYDRFEAFHAPLSMWTAAGSLALAGAAAWGLGRWLKKSGRNHSLFFIPVEYWGYLLLVGGVIAGGASFTRDGVSAIRSSFVSDCSRYEQSATATQCECFGNRLQATRPDIYAPFMSQMSSQWHSRTKSDATKMLRSYTASLSPIDQSSFDDAMIKGLACFDQGKSEADSSR